MGDRYIAHRSEILAHRSKILDAQRKVTDLVEELLQVILDQEDESAGLQAENDRLSMSNQKLVAELGRIAQALEVEPSMVKVLEKIEELKTATTVAQEPPSVRITVFQPSYTFFDGERNRYRGVDALFTTAAEADKYVEAATAIDKRSYIQHHSWEVDVHNREREGWIFDTFEDYLAYHAQRIGATQ